MVEETEDRTLTTKKGKNRVKVTHLESYPPLKFMSKEDAIAYRKKKEEADRKADETRRQCLKDQGVENEKDEKGIQDAKNRVESLKNRLKASQLAIDKEEDKTSAQAVKLKKSMTRLTNQLDTAEEELSELEQN